MDDIIFSGITYVDIHGKQMLQLLTHEQDHASYDLLGFDGAVQLVDYRHTHQKMMNHSPADLTIRMTETAVLQFVLQDSPSDSPRHRLWMATGDKETTPDTDHLFMQIAQLGQNQYAYLALCKSAKH
jgi:hypothetical protein